MQPTTVTSIVLALFGLGVVALALYNLLGDWQPEVRRISQEEQVEAEFQRAVRDMRRAIRDFERGR